MTRLLLILTMLLWIQASLFSSDTYPSKKVNISGDTIVEITPAQLKKANYLFAVKDSCMEEVGILKRYLEKKDSVITGLNTIIYGMDELAKIQAIKEEKHVLLIQQKDDKYKALEGDFNDLVRSTRRKELKYKLGYMSIPVMAILGVVAGFFLLKR